MSIVFRMLLSTCKGNNWALWASIMLWTFRVAAQSITSPAISQIMRLYNDSGRLETDHFPIDVFFSRDFQIVHTVGEGNLSDWRFLFDYSSCCKSTNPTIASIQQTNNNNLLYPPIRGQPVVALINRGGGCNWSEKLALARNISNDNGINLGAILIADNVTYGSVVYSRYNLTSLSGTVRSSVPLPSTRNIAYMPDNDIQGTAAIPTYFIPKAYGDYLHSLVSNTTVQPDLSRALYQLNFSVIAYWTLASSSSSNDKFSGTYIACIVVLVTIFVAALITSALFLRWWRRRQTTEQLEYETQLREHVANMQLRMKARPLPVKLVNAIPVAKYSPDIVKNNSCVVCFEDYIVEENELRILGCGHGFCVPCIDPWLTKKSTKCPICKYDCMPPKHQRQSTLSARSDEPSASEESISQNDPQPPVTTEEHRHPAKQAALETANPENISRDIEHDDVLHHHQTVLHSEKTCTSSSSSPSAEPCGLGSIGQTAEDGKRKSSSSVDITDDRVRSELSEAVLDLRRMESIDDSTAAPTSHLPDTSTRFETPADAERDSRDKS